MLSQWRLLQANILISKDGVAGLSDFGLSKFLEDVCYRHCIPRKYLIGHL